MRASVIPGKPLLRRISGGYGLARSLIATATLSLLFFNPPELLFTPTPAHPSGMRCEGVGRFGLWCVVGDTPHGQAAVRWVAVLVLAICASGWRPSWTCLPQWYITTSLGMVLPAPSGGDYVAQIMTMLLLPLALGDARRWHWGAPHLGPRWAGAADAALLAVRVQLSIVYLTATAAKVAQSEWRDGSALPAALMDPAVGLPPGVARLAQPLLNSIAGSAATWTVLGTEAVLAALILAPLAYRRLALALGIALHGLIGVLLGLPTFALAMIAALMLSAMSTTFSHPVAGCDVPPPKESRDAMARADD
jgi:antimicrobial peptide system SdpB family protein